METKRKRKINKDNNKRNRQGGNKREERNNKRKGNNKKEFKDKWRHKLILWSVRSIHLD